MLIKLHPRIINAHAAQIMPRYAPVRVTVIPATTDIVAAPTENGIILKRMTGVSEHTVRPLPKLTK